MPIAVFFHPAELAIAQTAGQTVITGNSGVVVEGKSAAGGGDISSDGGIVTGNSPDVLIGGKPAATVGADTNCGGKVVGGASTVFVNGKPLVISGSGVSGCNQ